MHHSWNCDKEMAYMHLETMKNSTKIQIAQIKTYILV